MVDRLKEKIKALEIEKADLVALMVKADAKIEVYNELIEEMTATEETTILYADGQEIVIENGNPNQ